MKLADVIDRAAGPVLSVGVNGADLLHLADDLERLDRAGVRLRHVDVMDGVFCPQMTGSPSFVAAVSSAGPVDVHLMIDEPLEKVDAYVAAGAAIVTFHVEATQHPHRVLQQLSGSGVVRGLALNPGTPLTAVEPLLDELDLILLLSVNPGWSGQGFIPGTSSRLRMTRELIAERDVALAVDGGVTRENACWVASLGADLIVAGTAVFAGGDLVESAREMLFATGSTPPGVSEQHSAGSAGGKDQADLFDHGVRDSLCTGSMEGEDDAGG